MELATKTSSFQLMERFVSIIFDEMKIQEDLVWDKYSGRHISFVDPGDTHTNFVTLAQSQVFKIHKALECNDGKDVVYRAKNIHAKENRFIYFFCDVPHLIKTARNCISNSGSGRATRFMWNNVFFHFLKSYFSFVSR